MHLGGLEQYDGLRHLFPRAHSMPHKHNADRRHHIPKTAFKAQDWPEYETALSARQPNLVD